MKHFFLILAFLYAPTYKASAQIIYGEKRVVFTKEMNLTLWLSKDSLYKRFTPTLLEIDSTDALLQKFILSNPNSKKEIIESYFRQYVGIQKGNSKFVIVYAFCHKEEQFLAEIITVSGGGHCYFTGEVNIDSLKVTNFRFNSPM